MKKQSRKLNIMLEGTASSTAVVARLLADTQQS